MNLAEQKAWTLKDFAYELPDELIAAEPSPVRTESRLLRLNRNSGKMIHGNFSDITGLLREGDVLVVNNTRVIPARLIGKKKTGGKAEALLIKRLEQGKWQALLKPGGDFINGSRLYFENEGVSLEAEVLDDPVSGKPERLIRFPDTVHEHDFMEKIKKIGHMPLPPYIQRPDRPEDRERYQTVFAAVDGACAAPTAGLHFDDESLSKLQKKGVTLAPLTLHVSYGTFQPVRVSSLEDHVMHEEEFYISDQTRNAVLSAKKEGRRIVACGTTSVRALESADFDSDDWQSTKLFILPPYEFKMVDAMITNFHLPESTLLMLVSAFGGYQNVRNAYEVAVKERYRFFSYGDAMFLENDI